MKTHAFAASMTPPEPTRERASSAVATVSLFVALLASALALGAGLAHAYELPNKLLLSREDYLVVQRIYSGWNRIAGIIGLQLVALLTAIYLHRDQRNVFWWTVLAFLGIALAQVVFWLYTFPANQATLDWTVTPANWQLLRDQWEFSHMGAALLQLMAFMALCSAVLSRR